MHSDSRYKVWSGEVPVGLAEGLGIVMAVAWVTTVALFWSLAQERQHAKDAAKKKIKYDQL